jgi:hypothetical protein
MKITYIIEVVLPDMQSVREKQVRDSAESIRSVIQRSWDEEPTVQGGPLRVVTASYIITGGEAKDLANLLPQKLHS